ncbi:helix-turn-helix domain-containing protein [Ramlibacter sp. AW1]|uniref:Helix-turn-helix domain-containing protein n=1 Tax=Ramlibacter aurantiacus TaxID=2801330 RepID=A0A936ZSL3_9BURK|nr:helix-turn-helix domain-containing protein [Ramlibacter aurantiacus]MBL0422890.1 helix-turn-helix domain-containing protein [Ramlibacter aurantiacus]
MSRLHQFTTAGHAPARNPDLFREQMARLFSVGLAISSPDQPFHTQVMGYSGRHLRFAALRFTPHTTSSTHVGQRDSRLLLSMHKEGVAVVQQDGRESRIEPGDMFLIDPARPFSIEAGEVVAHSVYLEPGVLRSVVPELDTLTARAIRSTEGAGAVFRGLLDALFAQADRLQEPAADRMADALSHALSAALCSLDGDQPPTTRLRAMHRQRILRYLRENLRNHDLDAAQVAAAVQLSTRYVYELFEQDGQPLMKWIWSSRLERCRNDLASPALASRAIGEIAYFWGFNDVAHFSRAFRQRFGTSPRAFRAGHERLAAGGTSS